MGEEATATYDTGPHTDVIATGSDRIATSTGGSATYTDGSDADIESTFTGTGTGYDITDINSSGTADTDLTTNNIGGINGIAFLMVLTKSSQI